ncbi:hypothetical protein C8R43DRAFT_1036245 [Mycena crocata]|nr:hypothetical protein C8R43DRAFT_1036245 [Mycena crocata]
MASETNPHSALGLDPILPADIEREIFEFAALSDPHCILKIILVAKRVAIWIEPLLYRTLSIEDETDGDRAERCRITSRQLLELLQSERLGASFFHQHIHHVALVNISRTSELQMILSSCSGIADLGIFRMAPTPALLPLFAALPLKRLSLHLQRLFGPSGIDFRHSVFNHITHLDIFPIPSSKPTGFGQLPCLTHISFDMPASSQETHACRTFFQDILANCRLLEALLLVSGNEDDILESIGECQYFVDDPRAVLMFVVMDLWLEDWETGAEGGEDYWVQADQFIKKRRSGEVEGKSQIYFSIQHFSKTAPPRIMSSV